MSRPKFIDDLAGVAGGAMSALTGMRDEIEQIVRARLEEAVRGMRLVRRDEFDAAVEMAANARAAEEDAAMRIAALERRVASLERGSLVVDEGGGGSAGASANDPGPASHPHLADEGGVGGPPPSD